MSRCNTMQYSALDAYSVYFFRYPTGTPNRPPPTRPIMLFSLMTQTHKTPQIFNLQGFAVYSSYYGGKRGIRTPGALRLNGFQDRRDRPLRHPSDRTKVASFFGFTKSAPFFRGSTGPCSRKSAPPAPFPTNRPPHLAFPIKKSIFVLYPSLHAASRTATNRT